MMTHEEARLYQPQERKLHDAQALQDAYDWFALTSELDKAHAEIARLNALVDALQAPTQTKPAIPANALRHSR
jgi:chromosome segregation ATPase